MKRTREEFLNWYHDSRWKIPTKIRDEWERKAWADWYHEMEISDHAHICHWSDVSPCTIIKKTKTTLTVRYDKARKSDKWNPQYIPGGFVAHCINNDNQSDWWIIEENPEGSVETFRWSNKYNSYRNTCGETLHPGWMYKYDYNF